MIKFAHYNVNVLNLDRSIEFYKEALGLEVDSEIVRDTYKIVYLTDHETSFRLELTYLFDHPLPYDLGECEFHLAFVTDDYEALKKKHEEMELIVFDNPDVGVYFITDPDNYWIEILPDRR